MRRQGDFARLIGTPGSAAPWSDAPLCGWSSARAACFACHSAFAFFKASTRRL